MCRNGDQTIRYVCAKWFLFESEKSLKHKKYEKMQRWFFYAAELIKILRRKDMGLCVIPLKEIHFNRPCQTHAKVISPSKRERDTNKHTSENKTSLSNQRHKSSKICIEV